MEILTAASRSAAATCIWRRARLRRGAFAACLVGLGALFPDCSLAASLETAIKATFLYKFASFIEWPSQVLGPAHMDFKICVVGDNPFEGVLAEAVAGENVMGHPIALRHLVRAMPNSGCEIMFVAGSPTQSVAAALAAVRGSPVLTVTDLNNPGGAAGIINFVIRDDHVRFEINRAAAAANGIAISSKLLSLAVPAVPAD
jgi:YfiR/HmsC-like